MSRQPRGGPRRRRPSRSAIRRELLVFAEGLRTEEIYLTDWHRRYRDQVRVTVDPFRGGPLQLVEHAVDRRQLDKRDERRGRGRSYDEIWCMFDIDEHPNVEQAVVLARDNDIRLAISNPCLELWFLLHFSAQAAWIDRKQAQQQVGTILDCGKALSAKALDLLFERYEDARDRAQRLDQKHRDDGSPDGSNPSSSVWQLTDAIGKRRPRSGR